MKKVYLFLLLCVCIQLSWGQDRATEIRHTFLCGISSLLIVVALRADRRNAPENSLQGIQNCIDMGVDMVDIDLKKTKDGHLVLMHDKLINRTMNGKGRPEDYTLAELKALRLKNGAGCKTRHLNTTFEDIMK